MQKTTPKPGERRLNIRVSEEAHFWINLDAARHGRSLQQHVDALVTERADAVKAQHGGVRPEPEVGKKGGSYTDRSPHSYAMRTCDRG